MVSEDRKGVILPIASVGGLAGGYHVPLYIATKHAVVGFVKSLKLAEKYEGIKVVTICPGAVDTPLWTDERRERVKFDTVESLQGDDVAKAMIDLVQDGKYGGGTLLEIMPNDGPKTRVVPDWNIDPPKVSSAEYNPFSRCGATDDCMLRYLLTSLSHWDREGRQQNTIRTRKRFRPRSERLKRLWIKREAPQRNERHRCQARCTSPSNVLIFSCSM